MSATPDPVREHLDAAETWLSTAETYRAKIAELEPETAPSGGYEFRVNAVRDQSGALLSSAIQIADLHRAMAQTINDLTPQRFAVSENGEREAKVEPTPDEIAAKIREQVAVDEAEHQAQTLRPGVDPEPEAEGELWTTGDGWFYYAVNALPPAPSSPHTARWLLVRHYAQVLRWSSEQGAKPMPHTWAEVGGHCAENERLGGQYGTLRRPTAEERAAFYGPEPDPQPAIEELHERTTTIPPAPVAWFPEDDVTMKAWLRGLDPAQLNRLRAAASNEHTERLYAE